IDYISRTTDLSRAQAYMLLTAAPVEGRYGGVVDLPNSSASLALPTGIFDTDILPKGALNDAARFGRPGTRCNLT
ncbi:acetamidase/formamidase family protein, partial [Alcaligenes nematophilus]